MNALEVTVEPSNVVELSPASSLLQVIERAARDSSIDIDKMERLLAMQERIVSRDAEVAFNTAMTAAQAQMTRVSADAVNPQTHSNYASYAQLDRALRPLYTRHGFSLSFGESDAPRPDMVRVTCTVSHIQGHSRVYHADMPADGKGAKGGDVMTKTHAVGAAKQYGMRYLIKGIFNVAVGENDKDGNHEDQDVPLVTESQVADLNALITEVDANKANLLKYLKVNSLGEIYAKNYSYVVSLVEKKRKK